MTSEEFIVKARAVHGDKYDYSKVEYVNSQTKVCIICPEHGEFWQLPNNHYTGAKCPLCAKEESNKKNKDVALFRIKKELEGTGYEMVEPFMFRGDRDTVVRLRCNLHNYSWNVHYHHLIFNNKKKRKYCGCKYCKLKYTKEICQQAALKCVHRSEFARRYKGEYFAALRNHWLDDICSHMKVIGNRYKRCIYVYEFPNVDGHRFAYIGLTDHLDFRDKMHAHKGTVFAFCKKHNLVKPKPIQLTNYVNKEGAKELEGKYLHDYIRAGWIPINIAKTGGLGGHLQNEGYTFQQCQEIGKKYVQRSEWKLNDYSTYYIASKMGWIDSIIPHNKRHGNLNHRYWTKERIAAEAARYKHIRDFAVAEPTAYHIVLNNNWMDELCAHMERLRAETGFTIEGIQQEIEKYDTLTDFINTCPRMYDWLGKRKIKLTDISNKPFRNPKIYQKSVEQYDLDGNLIRVYDNARQTEKFGFSFKSVSEVCNGRIKTHKGFVFKFAKPQDMEAKWNYDKCKTEASKCNSRAHFKQIAPYAYKKAREKGWLDDFFPN